MLELFLNTILPIIIIGAFFVVLLVLLFVPTRKNTDVVKNALYCSDSTNSSMPAKEVFESLENDIVKPNYLGCKKDDI